MDAVCARHQGQARDGYRLDLVVLNTTDLLVSVLC